MRDVKIYRFFSYKLKYLNEISMLNEYEEWKNTSKGSIEITISTFKSV